MTRVNKNQKRINASTRLTKGSFTAKSVQVNTQLASNDSKTKATTSYVLAVATVVFYRFVPINLRCGIVIHYRGLRVLVY